MRVPLTSCKRNVDMDVRGFSDDRSCETKSLTLYRVSNFGGKDCRSGTQKFVDDLGKDDWMIPRRTQLYAICEL